MRLSWRRPSRAEDRFETWIAQGHQARVLAGGTTLLAPVLMKRSAGHGSPSTPETRYSPGEVTGTETHVKAGNPDPRHIPTSFVERQNLTMRMSMRRFTRLTNGFSKKIENHEAMLAVYFAHYNFCRVHQTLRVTPAMEADLAHHVWSIEELVALLDS